MLLFTRAITSRVRHLFSRCLSTMDLVESSKKAAAYTAVVDHIKDGYKVGVGSGSTVTYAVEKLGEVVEKNGWTVRCVPTSFQAKELIRKYGLNLSSLDDFPELDVTIDGADEADGNLTLIKGGGGCLAQEKIVASCSKLMVVIADYRKDSSCLGQQWKKGVPIEVLPLSYVPVSEKIGKILGMKPILREAVKKCGPVVTDNGNFILDCPFSAGDRNWAEINVALKMIPGVVETGLFVDMAKVAYYGMQDGSVKKIDIR